MDYEKKLALAKEALKSGSYDRETIEYIFPELKEIEDEKIRKEIIEVFKSFGEGKLPVDINYADIFTWLEKQGESSDKIHYWTEEEIEPIISDYLRGAEHYGGMIARLRCLKPKSLEKQGEQKPVDFKAKDWYVSKVDGKIYNVTFMGKKQEEQNPTWSEDDKNRFGNLIWLVNHSNENRATKEGFIKFINRLKSLKPQPQWKPSEGQLEALSFAKAYLVNDELQHQADLLYNDLKRLKGE